MRSMVQQMRGASIVHDNPVYSRSYTDPTNGQTISASQFTINIMRSWDTP
jgi:hypothetical protein